MLMEKLEALIGEYEPIVAEGALFNGVDVEWCMCAIIVAVIITGFFKLFMCFYKR